MRDGIRADSEGQGDGPVTQAKAREGPLPLRPGLRSGCDAADLLGPRGPHRCWPHDHAPGHTIKTPVCARGDALPSQTYSDPPHTKTHPHRDKDILTTSCNITQTPHPDTWPPPQ